MSKTIAFQASAGAYSEQAIRAFYAAAAESSPCTTLEEIFLAVEDGEAEFGMLPPRRTRRMGRRSGLTPRRSA